MIRSAIFLLLAALAIPAASGAPIIWYISGTFGDGGSVFGQFTYNADTNTYSGIDITTTTGSVRSGATYTDLNPGASLAIGATQLVVVPNASLADLTGTPVFYPVFSSSLTNAGGTINLALQSAESACSNAGCTNVTPPTRAFTAGTVSTTSPVPEPSSMFLMSVGLGAVALMRRRRNASRRT